MARLFDDASNQHLTGSVSYGAGWPFTLACWVYIDDNTATQAPLGLYTAATEDIRVFLNIRGASPLDFRIVVHGTSTLVANTSTEYSVNTWHHICGISAGVAARSVFIDGGSKGTNTSGSQPITTMDTITIGRQGDSTPFGDMSGRIAEAAIWGTALTDVEVLSLARGFSPFMIRPQNLLHYVPLTRDNDLDLIGGLQLTASGGPTIATHPRIIYPAPNLMSFRAPLATLLLLPPNKRSNTSLGMRRSIQ